jgi:hypothetical protein
VLNSSAGSSTGQKEPGKNQDGNKEDTKTSKEETKEETKMSKEETKVSKEQDPRKKDKSANLQLAETTTSAAPEHSQASLMNT